MHDIADAVLRRGFARNQRLRPEPDDQRPGDNAGAETNARPGQSCKDRDHGIFSSCRAVRRRVLLSSIIISSCRRSSFGMGSASALTSLLSFSLICSHTSNTAYIGCMQGGDVV